MESKSPLTGYPPYPPAGAPPAGDLRQFAGVPQPAPYPVPQPPVMAAPQPRNTGFIVAVAALATALIAGAAVVVTLIVGRGNGPAGAAAAATADPAAQSADVSAQAPPARPETNTVTVTAAPASPHPAAPVDSAAHTDQAQGRFRVYSAPGPLLVRGPADYHFESRENDTTYYDAPGTYDHSNGAFFKVGISNRNHSTPWSAEVDAAATYLRSSLAANVNAPRYTDFLGTSAADIEYTFRNGSGALRHGIERIWRAGGVTLIITSSGPARDWGQTKLVFGELVANARD